MVRGRGPDFAHDLTEVERRTLDMLLARLRPADKAVRSWRGPVLVAAAAAVVLLAVGVVPLLVHRPGSPAPAERSSAGGARPPAEMLDDLAAAAGRIADPPQSNGILYRHSIDLVTSGCRITAFRTQTWIPAAVPLSGPVGGHLVVDVVDPVGALDLPADTTCGSTPTVYPQRLYDGHPDDLAAAWRTLDTAGLPRYASPRWVSEVFSVVDPRRDLPTSPDEMDRALQKLCQNFAAGQCAPLRWTVLVELIASAETTQAQRAAALRVGGESAISTVPDTRSDFTGRPGITVRVPYLMLDGVRLAAGGEVTTADLTFDPDTGRLLQSRVGAWITIELVATRVTTG